MKQLVTVERICMIGHIVSMAFGLAGLLLVVPNADVILSSSPAGPAVFEWSMSLGGVVYILLGTAAVAIYAYRTLGLWHWLTFMLPSVFLSLGSELLGTSTGFPFGHYAYLSGLGYKIAGLVPFTIPLSWFYLGLSSYLIARAGLKTGQKSTWVSEVGAIALGALLLTCWDFVLDPAMSQTSIRFWLWEQPGGFFGMPYQNFAGWFGTGVVFTSIAAFLWRNKPTVVLNRSNLGLPLAVYLSNFGYAAILSVASGFWIPVLLGVLIGIVPTTILWWMAAPVSVEEALAETSASFKPEVTVEPVKVGVK